MTDLTATGLNDLASAELSAATSAITAGDEEATRLARDIRRAVDHVNRESRRALDASTRLYSDDVSNPAGVARQLAAIPGDLHRATEEQLQQAEVALDVIEGSHLERILRHDNRDDANLRFELDNYIAGIKPDTAAATLLELAADPRYSTYLAGPLGKSLAARYGLKDPGIFRKVALESLAVNGTPTQIARSEALAKLEGVRRVIGLARGGRDNAAAESQRPPRREPSQALMS